MIPQAAKRKRALVCSYYLPQPDLDSASRRVYHLVNFLLDDGWQVAVSAVNPKHLERHGRWLRQRGVAVYPYDEAVLEQLLVTASVDLAILGFWHVAEPLIDSIRRLSPGTRIIVDSMDLHFVRHARRLFSSTPGHVLDATYGFETFRELNVYGAADLVLTVSEKEADLVNDLTADSGLARMVPDCEDFAASAADFDERHGMVFIGNFEHPPNADALKYLCEEIVPRLDPALLSRHPIRVVGNGLSPALRDYGANLAGVQMVGWVPAVEPYLERARLSVVPLRYGAGTKRKMIQSLAIGTPTVSTTVGIEGLALQQGRHLLVADDAESFAVSITTLLTDAGLWRRIAHAGRAHMMAHRSTGVARHLFNQATTEALARNPKQVLLATGKTPRPRSSMPEEQYSELLQGVRRVVQQHIPPRATVAVVSKGDATLLDLEGRTSWHFPGDEQGEYAGYYPADSTAAIEQLKGARARGAEFLVVPSTQLWWLEHYREFDEYLESRYHCVVWDEKICAIFDLRESTETDERKSPEALTPAARSRAKGGRRGADDPAISVIIPTFNRAPLLEPSLESLANQSAGSGAFEVIVIDDGSTDETAEVCARFSTRLQLRYTRMEQSGIAAAKNEGVRQAAAPIVLFFDDDDVAGQELVSEHVRTHEEYPEQQIAVLGYTGWAPSLEVTPVMRFITDVGHYLFSYDGLSDGQLLDYTYFWGGRSSCKTSLLRTRGLFRPEFRFGSEDIELGYRLSRFGLKVVFRRGAVQHMNRSVTYDEFCRRCERQGVSQWMFSRMHDDPQVHRWCGVENAAPRWDTVARDLTENAERVHELERQLGRLNGTQPESLLRQLWAGYWSTFDAFKLKGIVGAMHGAVPS